MIEAASVGPLNVSARDGAAMQGYGPGIADFTGGAHTRRSKRNPAPTAMPSSRNPR